MTRGKAKQNIEQVRRKRFWLDNASRTGKAVMRNKVFGGSLKKSPALKKQMAKDVF